MVIDWVHLHLMVNHFAVVLAFLGAATSIVALVLKRDVVWAYAAITLLLAGLFAPIALYSGRQSEEPAEHTWYANRRAIHEHEEAAERATWAAAAAAVLAIAALRRPEARWRIPMALVGLVAAAAMGYAGFEGGKIVHDNPTLEKGPEAGSRSSPEPS